MYNACMMPTTKPQRPSVSVRLPRALVDEVRVIAEAHDRSISAELRVALDAYVRREAQGARRILEGRTR
jgi:predicted transcriptional regulator